MSIRNASFAVSAVLVLAGCVVARPFTGAKPNFEGVPEQALREVAMEIERAVTSGIRQPDIPNRGGIVVTGQQVQQAIRTRAARAELVSALRETGYAVEKRDGLLYIEPGAGDQPYRDMTTRRERGRNAYLVMSENDDRWALYEGILDDSNLPGKSLGALQRAFYDARVMFLPEGHQYVNDEGDIVKKGAESAVDR